MILLPYVQVGIKETKKRRRKDDIIGPKNINHWYDQKYRDATAANNAA